MCILKKMDTFELSILDPESGIKYDLLLNKKDYVRANQDDQFASELLHHSRNISNENEEALLSDVDGVDNEKSTKTNYAWKYEQVVELIKSMGSHVSDLNHPKKRKQVFEHVANDMMSKCFEVSSVMVQNKWNSLLKSYRKAKDNRTKTGRAPSRFNFFELMDEIVGSSPANSCSHAINSKEPNSPENPASTPSTSSTPDISEDSTKSTPLRKPQKLKREYIQYKQEESAKKQKRHEEKMQMEEAKLELEKRKLVLLEKYLQDKI